jgi:hypothetical protein
MGMDLSHPLIRYVAGWEAVVYLEELVMPKLALYVPLKAKPGKESDVTEFLTSALSLAQAEPGTLTWYAIEECRGEYAIFDTFDT